MNIELIIFFIMQLVNVILGTIRSILTISGSKLTAVIINTVSFTFVAITTKMIAQQNFSTVIIVTVVTNLIGVYLGKLYIDKTKAEILWTITTRLDISNSREIANHLLDNDIQYILMPAKNEKQLATIFSYTKTDSKCIKELLHKYNYKYSVKSLEMS